MTMTRRERRQHSADMELGRRHAYWYGMGPLSRALMAVVAALLGLGICWLVAPTATLQGLRWAGIAVASVIGAWLFWLVALRRR